METAVAEPVQRLTYPISPEYVSGWTSERALSELVSNARDDDPGFTFAYADGVLTIEDQGLGVPEEGLVLGWSSKRGGDSDRFSGVHGEGLKIGSLVLARDPAIGRVVVETVGYGFVPTVTTNGRLVPLGGRRATSKGTQMLAYDFFESARTVGTKVTVECSRKLADAVRKRFRFLTDTAYQLPPEHGRVLSDAGGRLYIGGVYVNTNPKLMFSYDFSLSAAKRFQNRDRTVIDSNELDRLIGEALDNLEDPALIELWVKAALDGKLHRAEQRFTSQPPPAQRRELRAVAKRLFAGRKVTWSDGYEDEEAVLDLRDRGYEVLKAKALSSGYGQHNFFAALGIKKAHTVVRRPSAPQRTAWIKHEQLSASERDILTTAVRLVRGAFGADAVGACDAYESTHLEGADDDLRWGGFYEPTRAGRIGLQRKNLSDLDATLDVLVHEAAHRLRHRKHGNYDFSDRTRGFESQLGQMAARALGIAHAANAIPDPDVLIAEQAEREAAQALKDINHPAMIMRALIAQRMDATGLIQTDLADECGVSVGTLRQLRVGQYRSYGGHRHPDGAPQLKRTRAVCERLGLEWAVVHLAVLSENVWGEPYRHESGRLVQPGFCRRGRVMDKSYSYCVGSAGTGRVTGVRGDEMQACIDRLRVLNAEDALIASLQGQLDQAFDGSNGAWLTPYLQLVQKMAVTP